MKYVELLGFLACIYGFSCYDIMPDKILHVTSIEYVLECSSNPHHTLTGVVFLCEKFLKS